MSDDPYRKLVLDFCADDFTGLWLIVAELREQSGGAIDQAGILDILRSLLDDGLIQAGFPTADGRGFDPWPTPPEETLRLVAAEWTALGRDPNIGEVVWFTTTEKGDQQAALS